MFSFLNDPTLQRAILAAAAVAVIAGALGFWVANRKLVFAAEALPHAAIPGLALSSIIGISPLLAGLASIVLASATIWLLRTKTQIDQPAKVGTIMVGFLGTGLLINQLPGSTRSPESLLFGDLLGTNWSLVIQAWMVAAICLLVITLLHHQLLTATFDPQYLIMGVRINVADGVVLALLSLATLIAAQIFGSLLVTAFLIVPSAVAALTNWTTFRQMLFSMVVGFSCSAIGIWLSSTGVPAGPAITLSLATLYLLTIAYKKSPKLN